MTQLTLPTQRTPNPGTVLYRVWEVMIDGQWHTIGELTRRCGNHGVGTGISARVRELRKYGYTVDCERVRGDLYRYRVSV